MNSEAGIISSAHQGERINCGINCGNREKGCGIDSQSTVTLESILVPTKVRAFIVESIVGAVGRAVKLTPIKSEAGINFGTHHRVGIIGGINCGNRGKGLELIPNEQCGSNQFWCPTKERESFVESFVGSVGVAVELIPYKQCGWNQF